MPALAGSKDGINVRGKRKKAVKVGFKGGSKARLLVKKKTIDRQGGRLFSNSGASESILDNGESLQQTNGENNRGNFKDPDGEHSHVVVRRRERARGTTTAGDHPKNLAKDEEGAETEGEKGSYENNGGGQALQVFDRRKKEKRGRHAEKAFLGRAKSARDDRLKRTKICDRPKPCIIFFLNKGLLEQRR